jgi:hypothetical protein
MPHWRAATDTPKTFLAALRSLTTVRVMVISRSAFESIERNFPIASRLVLENLRRSSQAQVRTAGRHGRHGH